MSETDTSKIDDHQVYDFYLRMPFIPESAAQVSSNILQMNTPCLNKRVQVTYQCKMDGLESKWTVWRDDNGWPNTILFRDRLL